MALYNTTKRICERLRFPYSRRGNTITVSLSGVELQVRITDEGICWRMGVPDGDIISWNLFPHGDYMSDARWLYKEEDAAVEFLSLNEDTLLDFIHAKSVELRGDSSGKMGCDNADESETGR